MSNKMEISPAVVAACHHGTVVIAAADVGEGILRVTRSWQTVVKMPLG